MWKYSSVFRFSIDLFFTRTVSDSVAFSVLLYLRMKILLDYQTAVGGISTGVGVYTEYLTEALKQRLGEDLILARRRTDKPIQTILERLYWEQAGVLAHLHRHRPRVFHSPGFSLPFFYSGCCVATAHDIAVYKYPSYMRTPLSRFYWRRVVPQSLRKAAHIIAVSGYTRTNLVEYLRIPERKITVIHSGISRAFTYREDASERVFSRWKVKNFILFVGSFEERKNLLNLVKAYSLFLQRGGDAYLFLAGGRKGTYAEEVSRLIHQLRLEDKVILSGYVTRDELVDLYSAAGLLFFPTLEEGFGFPPLEAMACRCPVIASRRDPFLELLSGAALLVNPLDIEEMALSLQRIYSSIDLRLLLIVRGLECASQYTWEKTADATLAVYQKLCD